MKFHGSGAASCRGYESTCLEDGRKQPRIRTEDRTPCIREDITPCREPTSQHSPAMLQWWLDGQRLLVCKDKFYLYRDTATDGTCNLSGCQVGIPQGGVVDYTDVSTDSEQATMSAVAQQPVSIAIEVNQYSFQLYSSGVFTASCGTRLDHGVFGRRLRK